MDRVGGWASKSSRQRQRSTAAAAPRASAPCARRWPAHGTSCRCTGPGVCHVGDQHQRAHDVLHRFAQVGRRLQGFDHRIQRLGVVQIFGLEVHVQQGQRLDELGVGQRHQCREGVHRRGKAGHPRQHALRGRCLVVELVNPGVEPVAPADGLRQLGVAAPHQAVQLFERRAGGRRAAVEIGDELQPALGRHRLRLSGAMLGNYFWNYAGVGGSSSNTGVGGAGGYGSYGCGGGGGGGGTTGGRGGDGGPGLVIMIAW